MRHLASRDWCPWAGAGTTTAARLAEGVEGLFAIEWASRRYTVFALDKRSRVSFGLFVADLQTGELWKAGRRIRLQSQPFKVLVTLLEHAGEVVTREELQSRVWGPGTNVDFDRALAGAVNKVREALGDAAENPRFIETLVRRGYRFIAPVQVVFEPKAVELDSATSLEVPTLAAPPLAPPAPDPLVAATPTAPQATNAILARGAQRIWLIAGAALAVLLGWLGSEWERPAPRQPVHLEQITFDSPISPGPPNPETLPPLLVSGNRVITSILVNGEPEPAAISVTTGEVDRIALPGELGPTLPVDVSKDGNRLLVLSRLSSSSEQPLWNVPIDGGSAMRVGGVVAHDATWMPDGNGILYAVGDELWVTSPQGGVNTRLARLPGRAFWLRWAPNDALLRFTLIDPLRHTTALWEMKGGSRTAHPVSVWGAGHQDVCCGTWTAAGDYVFQQTRPNYTDIWELRRGLLGSTPLQLTDGPLRFFSPAAARSGSRVYVLGSDPPLGLQQFDGRQFAAAPAYLRSAIRISFSRDGRWAAWTDGEGHLWRARATDGSEKLQLTPGDVEVFSATWSPDGAHLAMMARRSGQPWQICLVSNSGGELRQLTHDKLNAADPTWSKDGRVLAFGGEPDLMGKESGTQSIRLFDLATGKISVVPGSEGLFSPRWSPDGARIAALTLDQKQVELFDIDRQQWSGLAFTSAADPVWSSDSQSLYVHAFLADQQPILRLAVPSGAIERVADLSDFRSREPANFFFSGLTPANRPLVLPRVGTSDLYSLDLPK